MAGRQKSDVLFFIYNDRVTAFFFDHYSVLTLGVGDDYRVADEGGGQRDLPPVRDHGALPVISDA
jgi:gallate dioxygenase